MLPFKVIYHPRYDLNLGAHVFPSQKFRLIYELLLRDGIAAPDDFADPGPASDADLLRVHTPEWIGKLKNGTLSASEIMKLEVPYSPELAQAVWLAAGGSILAGQLALRDGFACNLSGGFHHGNGTAHILRDDSSVFTLSIHQENNYPAYKPPSDLDIPLDDGVEDEEYLAALIPAVARVLDDFCPEILFYVGGADPYLEDQLGGLRLSKSGLKARDKGVFFAARSRAIPVVTTLAGGYARRLEDTVRIHANTIVAASEVVGEIPVARYAAS